RDRVAAIVKGIFLVPGVVELSSGPGDFSSWDTFGHLRLLGTIEKEFGVSFSDDDVLELNSVGDFCACVQKKLGQRDHDYERVHSESHA
ncbi:MAG TPA: acyl carrier protein, partial [Bacteroidota bacterium]